MKKNQLYYGDNLKILREYIKDESIDLIYLDPPFNSKADYNILFREPDGLPSQAQITAFEDTWHWTEETEIIFDEILEIAPVSVIDMMKSFRDFVGRNDVMAYLTMMCVRLLELHRALKETGCIYLHCDPTASHYLKILMDSIFGKTNYRNEIIWAYTEREISKKYWNRKHDIILFYTKSAKNIHTFNWEDVAIEYSPGTIKKFNYVDKDGRKFQIRGKGGDLVGKQQLNIELEKTNPDWIYRDYLDKSPGVPPRDWFYIPVLNRVAKERLGYPTQKPEKLLEKFILASSNIGDVVLDPFCGCGTTIAVSHRLKRNWIGIDITCLATNLIKRRLRDSYDLMPKKHYAILGEPEDLSGAKELASQNRYQFQWWALSLVDQAKPFKEKKKGADGGIDGILYFKDDIDNIQRVVIQVKSGKVGVSDIRDFCHVIDREKSPIGLFITLQQPTKPMVKEAVGAGFYISKHSGAKYSKIQILTIDDLLGGNEPKTPPVISAYKKAQKSVMQEKLI